MASTPSIRLSFFSMRAAQEAHVMPPIASSTSAVVPVVVPVPVPGPGVAVCADTMSSLAETLIPLGGMHC
ncbi:hypothetical protein EAO76_19880 [Streptomyces sp. sk2.1]|nr:hypothetical protein EAO76_19880 [Streptomyces sp. sk2.1]